MRFRRIYKHGEGAYRMRVVRRARRYEEATDGSVQGSYFPAIFFTVVILIIVISMIGY